MDPNIQIISETKEIEEDRNWIKILSFLFTNLVVGTAMFYFWGNYLKNLNSVDFLFFVVFLFIFLAVNVLEIFLVKGLAKILLFTFLSLLLPTVVNFFGSFQKLSPTFLRITILVFLICFYLVFDGKRKARSILNNSLEIKFFFISKNLLRKAINGLLLFLIFMAYLVYFVWNIGDSKIGVKVVEGLINNSSFLTEIIVPGVAFSPDKKMGEIVRSVLISKLKEKGPFIEEKNGNKLYFSQLPEEMQKLILEKSLAETEKQMKAKFSFFSYQMSLKEFLLGVVSEYFSLLKNKWGSYFYIGLIVITFVVLRGVFALFYWLVGLLAFLLLKMLVILGFAYETLETRTRKFVIVG